MFKHKDFQLEIKSLSEEGELEGYGSTFGGKPDSYGDIVMPGAFAKTLQDHKKAKTMPAMLFGHKASELPIGAWTEMEEDKKGLYVRGQLDMDDEVSRRIHSKAKKKQVTGLSIGYELVKFTIDKDQPGIYLLDEVKLFEVSVVTFPANPKAGIDAVKSLAIDMLAMKLKAGDLPTIREWEHGLGKALDLSKAQAERAVKLLLEGKIQGDPEDQTETLDLEKQIAMVRETLGGSLKI